MYLRSQMSSRPLTQENKNKEVIMENSYCTNCGAEMDSNAAFCVKCGVAKGKTKHFCGHCGASVTEEQDFCVKCGTKLSSKLDFSKVKESAQKVTKAAIQGTNNIASNASQKTGRKIKPAWLAGAAGVIVVIIIAVILLMPKGLSGTYVNKTSFLGIESKSTISFKGKNYTEDNGTDKEQGTYKISKDKVTLTSSDGQSITADLSEDHKSISILGIKYNKE